MDEKSWHPGGTQEAPGRSPGTPRRHPEATRRHPDHQGSQGRRKIDESMKNIEKLMVFLGFGAAHRAGVVKNVCFYMFLEANFKKP